MKLLVLGGTGFVGRTIVDEALTRHADVTVLNRGHRPPPAGVTALTGDRTTPGALDALHGTTYDHVIDTWSAAPTAVRDAAHTLTGRTGHYTYISSRSVYAYPPPPHGTEDAPLVAGSPDDGPDTPYAEAKRGAEIAVLDAFGDRALLARAGLILGPHEDIGRLPWWLNRIARGGTVPAPGPHHLPLQYIDARDLATFLLDAATHGRTGAYDLVSEPGHTTMGELLDTCVHVTGAEADLHWIDPDTILAAGVRPWTDLPVWLPPGPDHDGMHRSDVSKAIAAGLRCRPVHDTVADTWTWMRSIGGQPRQRPDRPTPGLDPAAEAALLTRAHAR
jgi:nucleoside-diphosphate-sugar epimerase